MQIGRGFAQVHSSLDLDLGPSKLVRLILKLEKIQNYVLTSVRARVIKNGVTGPHEP